ncbi:MAG: malate synthase G, partial [Gammaproteobacteria bacterium]|nr:malate synthase G [Gammaproteobacteria bacterium]
MSARVECKGLSVAGELYSLVNEEIIPGTGLNPDDFWTGLAQLVADLGPENKDLLAKRADIQSRINRWHHDHPGPIDLPAYKQFLEKISYLIPEG